MNNDYERQTEALIAQLTKRRDRAMRRIETAVRHEEDALGQYESLKGEIEQLEGALAVYRKTRTPIGVS